MKLPLTILSHPKEHSMASEYPEKSKNKMIISVFMYKCMFYKLKGEAIIGRHYVLMKCDNNIGENINIWLKKILFFFMQIYDDTALTLKVI